ncbi:MAG: hypothetical protein CVV05_00485 [Gammaproteobacteria bacterium HGW-Gammaproteobacteria-1]|jgi:hypothetical protein|nr:MAG: hypothetical protein CVV05_00485 [Gammaproteobacteria bacterium HGW-Gammaproteobacteria-1]
MSSITVQLEGPRAGVRRLMANVDEAITYLAAAPAELLALQQALRTPVWTSSGAQVAIAHPAASLAAERLAILAQVADLRVAVLPADTSHAPLSETVREQLRRDAGNVLGVAARKRVTCTPGEAKEEAVAARTHFELGCWLNYYSARIGRDGPEGLVDRIDCARRLFEAGMPNPGNQFFTVFDFGERQSDSLFEMGDGDQVKAALLAMAEAAPDSQLAKSIHAMGWQSPAQQRAAACAPTL